MKDVRCCENLKFRNFTLSFGRLRQRIVLKCVPHVQHDYFSFFNQSDQFFSGVVVSVAVVFVEAAFCSRPCRCSCQRNGEFPVEQTMDTVLTVSYTLFISTLREDSLRAWQDIST